MTQRELTIIEQLLVDYLALISKRDDAQSKDKCRQINRILRAVATEKQHNRNNNLIDTIKSWLKNTATYLFRR